MSLGLMGVVTGMDADEREHLVSCRVDKGGKEKENKGGGTF
jgi:hypothetical protein